MIRLARWFLIVQLATSLGLGATWYVDLNATGANNGTSWTNAWESLTNIAWKSLSPGDVVQIAKGTYGDTLKYGADGTSNAPILIQPALSDTNRLGLVTFAGGVDPSGHSGHNWVTMNGAYNTNYPVPASVAALWPMTNNMAFRIHTTNNAGMYDGYAGTGLKFYWINVDNNGYTNSTDVDGLHFQLDQNQTVVAYCWVHDNYYGYSLDYNTCNNPSWGGLTIHDCIFQNTGDDMFHIASGTDVYRCYIEWASFGLAHGHTDCFQTWDNMYRIHNNIIHNFAFQNGTNDYCSISMSQFSLPQVGDFLFYNNLIYNDSTNWLTKPGLALSFDAWWATNKLITNQVITNVVIANNLFSMPDAAPFGFTLYGAATDTSRGTNVCHTFTNCLIANNIILNCYNWGNEAGASGAWSTPAPTNCPIPVNPGDPASVVIDTNSLPLLNNISYGPNWGMNYMGVNGNIAAVGAATGMTSNWTNCPLFAAYTPLSSTIPSSTYDFHLQAGDTVARGKGYDMSAYTNSMPLLDVDIDGNPRPATGAWDIGPYQETALSAASLSPAAPTWLRVVPAAP